MKCAFADIRNHRTEPTAAPLCGPIQTQKRRIAFRAHAKHSKRKKLLMPAREWQGCASGARDGQLENQGVEELSLLRV
jgi:hypothetical protein